MAWKFHYVVWGGITVSVMPLTKTFLQVVDSNVGVVLTCEHLGRHVPPNKYEHMDNVKLGENDVLQCAVCGAVPGSVVVKDGQKPDCDFGALARVVGGTIALQVLEGEKPS